MKMKTTTLSLRNSIGWSPWQRRVRFIPLTSVALVCFALSPTAQGSLFRTPTPTPTPARTPPPTPTPTPAPTPTPTPTPDGDQGHGNTAEGNGALFSLTTGTDNTAIGFEALFNNSTGGFNTAIGSRRPARTDWLIFAQSRHWKATPASCV